MKTFDRAKGFVLMTSLVIALIATLWIVAALVRAKHVSFSNSQSAAKTDAYFLAKTGISRSLAALNQNPSWANAHNSEESAFEAAENTKSWLEVRSGQGLLLYSRAKFNNEVVELTVPIQQIDGRETKILSSSPALGGGPHVIARSGLNVAGWKSLPPLPVVDAINFTVGNGKGDVFATSSAGSRVWRYRVGRGWTELPSPPAGLENLVSSEDSRLIGRTSDNTIAYLDLDENLSWSEIPAPSGTSITNVAAPISNKEMIYSTTRETGQPPIVRILNMETGIWSELPTPTAITFDSTSGQIADFSGQPSNFSGGLAVTSDGHVFVGSNESGKPAAVYEYVADGMGSTSGQWRPLPYIPSYSNGADGTVQAGPPAQEVHDLAVDSEDLVWLQWKDSSGSFGNLQLNPNAE